MAVGDLRPGFLFHNDPSLSLEERRKAQWLAFADYGREYFETGNSVVAGPPVVIVLTSPSAQRGQQVAFGVHCLDARY